MIGELHKVGADVALRVFVRINALLADHSLFANVAVFVADIVRASASAFRRPYEIGLTYVALVIEVSVNAARASWNGEVFSALVAKSVYTALLALGASGRYGIQAYMTGIAVSVGVNIPN